MWYENWAGNFRDAEGVPEGKDLIDVGVEDYPLDQELASILGMERIHKDDDAQPYNLEGLRRLGDGTLIVVIEGSVNLAIGKDYSYSTYRQVSEGEGEAILAWWTKRMAAAAAVQEKEARIEVVLKEHGLDDESVRLKREDILRKHGLL